MYEEYKKCMLCPRRCGVDRTRGERGFCGADATLYAGRAAPHYYEAVSYTHLDVYKRQATR